MADNHSSLYTYHDVTKRGYKRKIRHIRALFSYFLPPLEPGAYILEVGPGRGEFASEALKRGYQYIGIEPSKELGALLVQQGYKIIFEPIPKIDLPDNTVDLVYSADVIEHLTSYIEILDFFSESHRVLRPNGYIAMIAPNFDTLGLLFFLYEYQHTFITNTERIEGLMKDSGFIIERTNVFLTSLGLTKLSFLDRIFAHTVLPVFRNSMIYSILRKTIGRNLVFRIHKNLCDHLAVLGKK